MLKTAAQHEFTVTTSLQRLPHPYNPQNTVTTSSNPIYYVIRNSFQHKIGVFLYSIEVLLDSILIYIIYCKSLLWNINRLQPDSFKSTGVAKCPLPQIAIWDVVSADVVDECGPSDYDIASFTNTCIILSLVSFRKLINAICHEKCGDFHVCLAVSSGWYRRRYRSSALLALYGEKPLFPTQRTSNARKFVVMTSSWIYTYLIPMA